MISTLAEARLIIDSCARLKKIAHGLLGYAEDVGDVVERIAFERRQQQYLALDRRQRHYRAQRGLAGRARGRELGIGQGVDLVEQPEQLGLQVDVLGDLEAVARDHFEAGAHIFVAGRLAAGERARVAAQVGQLRGNVARGIGHRFPSLCRGR
jgi:hypothetical protein